MAISDLSIDVYRCSQTWEETSLGSLVQILISGPRSLRPNRYFEGGDSPNDTCPEKTSGSSYFTGKMEGKVPGVVG